MNNERPFENIVPIQNIKVGYFEKEEYLKIIDRQEKQIQSFGVQIMALQSRIDVLEKNKRLQGEWKLDSVGVYCSECKLHPDYSSNFCPNCGADMKGGTK